MKIGIDCRLSGISHAGIGRYIENLISRLPDENPDIEWVYFYRSQDQILKKWKNVKYVAAPIRHYTFQEQLQLLSIFNQEKLDLLHVPHFNIPIMYPGKLVVTIHDLLWHQQKGTQVTTLKPWQYWGKYAGYKMVASQAINKADKILVPTNTIKKTLQQYYPGTKSKITVTHEGVDQRLLKYKNIKVKKKPNSLIYVGSLYPHKNVEIILKALQELPQWKLTVVGSRDVFQQKLSKKAEELEVSSQIKFAGYLTDKDLAREIITSTALIQPSLSEGFGLTGIEALSLNTPLIASKIPVFKEIYQDAAIYFNPKSSDELVKQIKQISKLKPVKDKMKKITDKYCWDEMTRETLKAYQQVLK